MIATQELIAAALALAALAERNTDDRDEWQHAIDSVREACARAMVQPATPDVVVRPGLEGWKGATIAWEVCASIHREYAKDDPFFTTRQGDFVKHAEAARAKALAPEPDMAERDALIQTLRGRVPDLLDRISAAHDASLDEHETCRGLLRECLASLILTSTAPSAPAAPAEPVKLPYPDKIGVSPDGISYHSDDCIRTYGDAREAAGYARGRAEQQAVIDRLMMEHCPDEMTAEQRQTWAAAQAEKGGE